MIIIVSGGIGMGKTLSVVKEIIERNQNTFTNFNLFDVPFTRLRYDHLFKEDNKKLKLNFKFWKDQVKKGGFDIYLDEFHNVMGSRRSMSKQNVLLSNWLSQIRKILGSSERNHLYLLTQKLRRIDINSRDLSQLSIKCDKQLLKNVLIPTEITQKGKTIIKKLPMTIIYKSYFKDADTLDAYEKFGVGKKIMTTRFIGNWYYKYFDSYELIDFGSEDYV